MQNDIKLLLRLYEVYEAKLLTVSDDYECTSHRKEYRHEYTETKAILNLLNRLITNAESDDDK